MGNDEIPKELKDVENLISSCMMSKSEEIRIETYSTTVRIVNVN